LMSSAALIRRVKGIYCVIVALREATRIRVGSLGKMEFSAGVYVYVGSGMAGVEHRIDRHSRKQPRKRWHIDYLMEEAEYIASVAIPCEAKEVECGAAIALSHDEGVIGVVKGFGCSDCDCGSHLIFFGDVDPELVAETVSLRLSMLKCVYPGKEAGGSWTAP
jgi:Uri superfamily endonuclease